MRPEASAPSSLSRLQRWMQAVVTHPCCAPDGLVSSGALREHSEEELPSLVRGDERLSPVERLGVYQGMHLPRMVDALSSDYPLLRALLGGHAFEALVSDYVRAFPSRTYTLNRLGDHLPEFVAMRGPRRGRSARANLASLELARTEVFDAPPSTPVAPEDVASVPEKAWPSARLVPIAALRVVALRRGTLALAEALESGAAPPALARGLEHALVFRPDLSVRLRALAHHEGRLLRDLASGTTVGGALRNLASEKGAPAPDAVFGWVRRFLADGLVSRILVVGS